MASRDPNSRPTAADQAFARFCRTGDADALAEVFDLTAPRLAVLAGHIVPGDGQAVEELVQTTFIEAMRSARRFEAGRPVLPWLIGILGRQAASQRRERRRRAKGDTSDPDPGNDDLDPARLVADRDFAEHVARAIDELQGPYRHVLALRLVHGLTPAEIARALDRPLGTVHTQLHRGGALLKRKLPPIAMALVGILTSTNALAAVRSRVLQEIARHAPIATPPAAVLGGLIMMKKIIAAGLALAALAALALLAFSGPGTAPPMVAEGSGSEAITAMEGTDRDLPVETDPADSLERIPALSPWEGGITFTGRVVAAESRAPLAGAEVELTWWDLNYNQVGELESVSTNADGRYELRVLAENEELTPRIAITAPGRAIMRGSWVDLPPPPGGVVDSGDILMGLGADLSLRVLDESGEPVSFFEIQLGHPEHKLGSSDGRFSVSGWGGIQGTDTNGIAGPKRVLAGIWEIQYAEGTGHRYEGPRSLVVPADQTQVRFDLNVETPDLDRAISGVLVDEKGIPLEGVEIRVQRRNAVGLRVSRSFGRGRFQVPSFRPEDGPVTVVGVGSRTRGAGFDYELLEPTEPVEIGVQGLRVVARHVSKVAATVRVVAFPDLEPVERFRAKVVPVAHNSFGTAARLKLPPMEHHPGGLIHEDEVLPYDHLIIVVPERTDLQPVLFQELQPAASEQPTDAVLRPSVRWQVRVTDPTGTPVVGSTVELLRGVGRTEVTPDSAIYSWESAFDRGLHASHTVITVVEEETNDEGLANLRTAGDVEGTALRIRGPRHVEVFLPLEDEVTNGETREVVVEPAARVIGRLEPPELVSALGPPAGVLARAEASDNPEEVLDPYRIQLSLRQEAGDYRTTTRASDDGHFTLDAVPPGDYTLWTRFSMEDMVAAGPFTPLGELRALRPGEERDVTIDLRPVQPATVRAQVYLDGAPPPRFSEVYFGSRTYPLDPDGRFQAVVRPGEKRVILRVRETVQSQVSFEYSERPTVHPGSSPELTLRFFRKTLELRVTGEDGEALGGQLVGLHRIEEGGELGSRAFSRTLDADGRGTFEGSWHEPLMAVLWFDRPGPFANAAAGRHAVLGRVEVPRNETTARYELSVDPKIRR